MPRQIDALRGSSNFDAALERARAIMAETEIAPETEPASPFESGAGIGVDDMVEALRTGHRPRAINAVSFGALEAIVLADLRPAYFIENDRIAIDGDFDHVEVIETNRDTLEAMSRRVGRVDLLNHASFDYAGTGWLIADDIVVTNRHVAHVFATQNWTGQWDFQLGTFDNPLHVQVNTMRQHGTSDAPTRILLATEVLYVAPPSGPDIAFLRVVRNGDIDPIPLCARPPRIDRPVAAVGYPARDAGRNDPVLMDRIFKSTYKVKRFSPGLVTGTKSDQILMLTDYSSLGGNSGSLVMDLETGEAVGLHFAGAFRETNYAVAGDIVAAALREVKSPVVAVSDLPATEETPAADLAGREGYDAAFLGPGLAVPLPCLGARQDDLAPVDGAPDGVLRYTHFSVLQSKSRRLPMLTAVNIDGAKAMSLKRQGSWRLDGRLSHAHQVGNALYRANPLDRGHMVRRKDPGWGDTEAEARQAERDTFHYTNAAPQHEDLNQRDWLGLEDYILEASDTHGFRISVMTGPVFREDDQRLREQPGAEDVQIPQSFWKVAAMVNDATGALSATGYLLTQGDLIRHLTEAAFVLGAYRTYQVKIGEIERLTGFDFGPLRDSDPLRHQNEAVFGQGVRPIDGPESLILSERGI